MIILTMTVRRTMNIIQHHVTKSIPEDTRLISEPVKAKSIGHSTTHNPCMISFTVL